MIGGQLVTLMCADCTDGAVRAVSGLAVRPLARRPVRAGRAS